MSHNNFGGTLEVISEWSQLTNFDASNNNFTGVIPDISRLSSLQSFQVQNNKLQRLLKVPNSLTNCNISGNDDLCKANMLKVDVCGYENLPICVSKAISPFAKSETITLFNSAFGSAISSISSGLATQISAEAASQASMLPVFAVVIITLVSAIILGIIIWYLFKRRHAQRLKKIEANSTKILKRLNDDLVLTKELNSGGYGVVYKGFYKGIPVAVKQLLLEHNNVDQYKHAKMFMDEAEVMLEMKHERIVKLFDIDISTMALIMELMDNGSLHSYISKNKKMDWLDRYQIMLDINEGMAFLHANENEDRTPKKRVLHQDLKSGNILLTMNNGKLRGKIGDFGLASECFVLKTQNSRNCKLTPC